MSTLRSKVIRLAHAKPELRPHLLPLVARRRKEAWGAAEKLPDYLHGTLWRVYADEDTSAYLAGELADAYDELQEDEGYAVGEDDDRIDRIRGIGKLLGTVDHGNLAVYKNKGYEQLTLVRDINGPWGVDIDVRRPRPDTTGEMDEAVVISDNGFKYSLAIDGKFIGEYGGDGYDEMMDRAKRDIQRNGGYYTVNDHGNIMHLDSRGNEIDSWV